MPATGRQLSFSRQPSIKYQIPRIFPLLSHNPPSQGISLCTTCDLSPKRHRNSAACARLSEKGLLRWYVKCCNTPIGNTVANYRVSFIGLVHSCLDSTGESLDASFGPVRMWSFTRSAKGAVNAPSYSLIAGVARFAGMVIRARFDGTYKRTPLFVASTGAPIVTPQVLSPSERERLRNAV
jgi:uncharacterized protein DUF6151